MEKAYAEEPQAGVDFSLVVEQRHPFSKMMLPLRYWNPFEVFFFVCLFRRSLGFGEKRIIKLLNKWFIKLKRKRGKEQKNKRTKEKGEKNITNLF